MRFVYGLVAIILGCLWGSLHAEIITDGSLGIPAAQTLTAPNYIIAESSGLRQGSNLFHSFSHFNVLQGETATFQADANVGNILARVTGNELSTINGIISTEQSNANLWLINPNGWLIGSHASFDIHGALHISTANAVDFGRGDKFYADPKQSSQLSIGAPLTLELDRPSQAAITIDQADLQLSGHIQLLANSVNLHKATVSDNQGVDIIAKTLHLDETNINTNVVESGDAGSITIQAENMQLSGGSSVNSDSQINSKGNAGHIDITLKNELNMTDNSAISSYNNGSGAGGTINLTANQINLDNNAAIRVNSNSGKGNAGQLTITANSLNLTQGGTIDSSTVTQGKGGDINISTQQLTMTDPETFILSEAYGKGQGGTINIQSEQITVTNKAQISTLSKDKGNAGSIVLNVKDQFRLDDAKVTTQAKRSDGGPININADTIFLRHGQITTSVKGPFGDGGNITMKANNLVMDGGFIQANTAAQKASGGKIATGGDIQIDAKRLFAGGNEVLVGGNQRLRYDPDSRLNVIQAAAERGIAGNVTLNTVELNVAGQLLPLDSRFLTQRDITDNPCQAIRGQQLSSLVAIGHGGLPTTAVDQVTTHLDHYLTSGDWSTLAPASGSPSFPALSCPESGL